MGLTARLRTVARPCPLVVTAPGGTRARLGVERAVRELGWPMAATPAEADLLVVCGPVGPELATVLEGLWRQIPAPRARAHVTHDQAGAPPHAGAAVRTLTAARAQILVTAAQRAAASDLPAHGGDHAEGDWHGDHAAQHGEHSGHAEHGGHGGMETPAGLPMADRADDRDGLKLDQLHVPLGPVLPDWPAGLVIHTALQGDVIQTAEVEILDMDARMGSMDGQGHGRGPREAADRPVGGQVLFWDEPWLEALAGTPVTRGAAARRLAAARLDSLARLLGVAGWADAAMASRWCRDDLLAGADLRAVAARFARAARRLRRSRALRWLTGGLGVLDPARAAELGVGEDVLARWLGWVDGVEVALADIGREDPLPQDGELAGPRGRLDAGVPPSGALLEVLSGLVTGAELAAARLIAASLDPDPDELVLGAGMAVARG